MPLNVPITAFTAAVLKSIDETKQWMQKKSKEFLKLMSCYRCAMMEVETRFLVLYQEHVLEYERNPISTLKTRLKTLPSIEEKLKRRGFDVALPSVEENLDDIAGVRVICYFPDDVYALYRFNLVFLLA